MGMHVGVATVYMHNWLASTTDFADCTSSVQQVSLVLCSCFVLVL